MYCSDMVVGFIGQGWIGKHYADDFEARGYTVVRYSLEEPYIKNKGAIASCDVVFIAVPTPTTAHGFDDSTLRAVLPLVGAGTCAVIKSTIIPGTTERLQQSFPHVVVVHSPEFLREASAGHDAAHPLRNIIGIPIDTSLYRTHAEKVLALLPKAPYEKIMSARDAELVKYGSNTFLYTKVVYMNLLYDAAVAMGGSWDVVRDALIHDPRIGESHTQVFHASGRGAGGHCFIKDFEAFTQWYTSLIPDDAGTTLLKSIRDKNLELLAASGKDAALRNTIYPLR